MSTRHPSRRRLRRWLADGTSRRVHQHVEGCEQCQAALDEWSRLDAVTVSNLEELVEPPDDFGDRITEGVDDRLRNEAAAGAFLDLFSIGWDVLRHAVDPAAVGPSSGAGEGAADNANGGTA